MHRGDLAWIVALEIQIIETMLMEERAQKSTREIHPQFPEQNAPFFAEIPNPCRKIKMVAELPP